MRFDRRIRLFGSAMFVVGVIVWLPIAVYVPALTFNQVSGINIHVITPIVCIVCTFYTCVGGLKAVVWTDVLQSFVMFGSIFLVIIKGTMDLGGFGVVWQRNADSGRLSAPEMSLDPTVRLSVLSVFIGGTLHKLQSSAVNQITIQRFISLPSTQKARHTLIIFTIGLTLLLSCCAYVGLLTFATYHDCDPLSTKLAKATDQLVPLLVMHILGVFPGLPGLFVSGVFSAALSSLSTGLNSLACVILEDFINPAVSKPLTERQTAFVLRFTVAFFGLSCIGLVFVVEKLGMVLQLATTVGAVTQGPLLGIFFMGICMPWINGKSALTGSVVSFVVLGWTCIKAQIALATGELRFSKKPVSVEGCLYGFDNSTLPTEEIIPSEKAFHHMSFLWYSAFGGALTILVACIASLWFGRQDVSELDESLFAPCIRRFLKSKKYASVQLEEKFGGLNNCEKEKECETKLTANDYFERRFDRRIQLFGAILFIIESSLWLPIAVYVPALTFNQVTGIDIHIITPIVCAICTFYTCVGGIKAVVCADFIQGFVMFGSVFLVMIKGTMDVGGFGEVWQRNKDSGRVEVPDWTFDPTVRMSMLAVIVGGTIYKIQDVAISQPAVQRFISLPSMAKIRQTLIYSCFGLTILLVSCVYVGMVTFATYHDCDPLTTKLAKARDQLVPLLVMDVLGKYPGLGGLFVSAVFSAALSSLSTVLNSLSAVILEDFAKPFSRHSLTENQMAIVMKSTVIFFGVMAVAMVYVVEKLGMVLQLSATLQSITKGPMLGIFIVGMCMPWVNSRSVLVGTGISFLTMGWICIRAQVALVRKEIITPTKPVSVEGCTYDYVFTPPMNSSIYEQPLEVELGLHHVSWLWYGAIGALLTVVCSNLAMIVFGVGKWDDVDVELVAPFLRKYYKPKKYESVSKIDMAED